MTSSISEASPVGIYLYHQLPLSQVRWERQFYRSNITTICNAHILSIISRNTSFHIDQIPLGINLLYLPLINPITGYQEILNSTMFVSHMTRHLLSFERLSRILQLISLSQRQHDADLLNQENDEKHSHHVKHQDQRNPSVASLLGILCPVSHPEY